jgi:hypothetical protein
MTQTQTAPATIVAAAEELETSILRTMAQLPHPMDASLKAMLMAVQQFNFEQRGIK